MRAGALDERFVRFMCYNGPDWWNLPRPDDDDTITIRVAKAGEVDIPNPTVVPSKNDVISPLGWTENSDRYKIGLIA